MKIKTRVGDIGRMITEFDKWVNIPVDFTGWCETVEREGAVFHLIPGRVLHVDEQFPNEPSVREITAVFAQYWHRYGRLHKVNGFAVSIEYPCAGMGYTGELWLNGVRYERVEDYVRAPHMLKHRMKTVLEFEF